MFFGITLSTENYDEILNGWSTQTVNTNLLFSGGNSKYCSGEVGRNILLGAPNNWTITDGGLDVCTPSTPITAPDLQSTSDTGSSDIDNITSDPTPSFDVVCTQAGNTITLYADGVSVGTHTCVGVGTETVTANTLTDGTYSVTYTDTYSGSESAHSPALTLTIDTTAPATPVITSIGGDTSSPYLTNDNTPSIVVTTIVGDIVTIPGYTCTPSPATGTSITCTAVTAYLDGVHSVTPTIVDITGNITVGTPTSFTIETTSPSNGGSSSGIYYICKDRNASNYNNSNFGRHKASLCQYDTSTPVIDPGTGLGTGETCSSDILLTQNMKAGARNGRYHSYTKAIVQEVKILQAHMNRLGFKSGPVDGILGPITDGAIKRMQIFLGTQADGFVGPITRSLINKSC